MMSGTTLKPPGPGTMSQNPGTASASTSGKSAVLRSKALFQAALGAIRFRKSLHPDGPLLLPNEQKPLVMGALVSLYSVEADGFFLSEGFVNTNCVIAASEKDKTHSRIPANFEDCVFRIVPKHKYDARNYRSSQQVQNQGVAEGMLFSLFFHTFSFFFSLFLSRTH
jgi:hypothetical protein